MKNEPGLLRRLSVSAPRSQGVAVLCLVVALGVVADAATTRLLAARLAAVRGVFSAAEPPPVVSWREAGGRTTVQAAERGAPWIRLRDGVEVRTEYAGEGALAGALKDGETRALALASGDFDEDGVADLVAAHAGPSGGLVALHRGNVDAIYPNAPEAQARKASGTYTDAPFLAEAAVFAAPAAPDFVAAGDFDGDGHADVVAGTRGGESLYLLAGDGRGALGAPREIPLPGRLTALAAGEVNRRDGMADVVAGVAAGSDPLLLVFEHPRGAFSGVPETTALPAEATEIAVGNVTGSALGDVAVAAGRRLVLVHGRDRLPELRATSPEAVEAAEVETRSFRQPISSLAIGNFAGNGRRELAVLTEDGALRAVAAPGGDRSKGLREWEASALVSKMPVRGGRLVRASISGRSGDELVVLDAEGRRLHVVEGGDVAKSEGAGPVGLDVESAPVAVLPMRLNRDGLSDLVVLGTASKAPTIVETTFQTFTVTTADDSGAGSLRDAIAVANEIEGADVIDFNIAPMGAKTITVESPLPDIAEGVTIDATTQPGFAGTPIVQLVPSGAVLEGSGLYVGVVAAGSVIRGLAIGGFPEDGINIQPESESTTVEGNYIGVHPDGVTAVPNSGNGVTVGAFFDVVGGTTSAARNVISGNGGRGVFVQWENNTIQGNYIGTNAAGTGALSNGTVGVETSVTVNTTIGGDAAGAGNVISGHTVGTGNAHGIKLESSDGNLVQGNVVGLAAGGTSTLGNTGHGILVNGGFITTIGGSTASARNVVSDNGLDGIRVASALAASVVGNVIGLDAAITSNRHNKGHGVEISSSSGASIGDGSDGSGNVIATNLLHGVLITNGSQSVLVAGNFIGTDPTETASLGNVQNGIQIDMNSVQTEITDNRIHANGGVGIGLSSDVNETPITGNEIWSNSGLGIDLGNDGVTANDAGDEDIGANSLVNFPVITSAILDGGVTTVEGQLDASPNTDYTVEFFVNIACDPSGNGEGNFLAGTVNVSTDGLGTATFSTALTESGTPGNLVTATATQLGGFGKRGGGTPIRTSEFSACFPVGSPPVAQADLEVTASDSPDPVLPGQDVTYTVTLTNNGPETATKVSLSAFTPAGTTFQSADAPPGWNVFAPPVGGTGEVLLALGTFNSGDSAIFTIVLNVDPDTPGESSIDFSATATADQEDPDPANSTVMESTFVEPQSDVAVTNEAAAPQVLAGQEITYTITATNNGPDPAFFVRVEDATPTNTTFVSATVPPGWSLEDAPAVGATGTVSWTRSPVASGEMATFTLVVRVDDGTPGGTLIQNFASANGEFSDPNLGNNSAPADVTVTPQVDVAVTQTDAPDPVTPGQNITYTVSVAFNGPDPAGFATYTGATPANTTFQSVSLPPNWSVDQAPEIGGTGTIALVREGGQGKAAKGMLLEQITVVVQVDPGTPGGTMITNMVSVAPEGFDPNSADNTSVETTTVQSVSDLSITAMVSPDPVLAGNDLTFTLEVTNNGPDDAFGLTLQDAVPANTTFKSISVPPFWTPAAPFPGNTGPISAITGGLPNGETATITYVVTVNPGTPAFTEISNNATIFVDPDVDPNAANDTATASAFVASTVDLAVTQTDSPDPVLAGQDVTYTITVVNNGPDFPLSLSLDGAVPANTTFQSLTTPPGWDAMTPPVGGTGPYSASIFTSKQPKAQKKGIGGVFTLVVRVDPGTAGGTIITNSVSVSSPQFDPNGANNTSMETTTVAGQADLAVTKGAAPDPVLAGADVTYTIQVTNNGPDSASATVADATPANTTFRSISAPPGWSAAAPAVGGTGPISVLTPALASGAGGTITIVVRVDPGTPGGTAISNTTTVSTGVFDPSSANDSASATVFVEPQVDLAVTQTDAPDPVVAGQEIAYTITLANNGPDSPSSAVVSGTVPANTTFQSFEAPAGWDVAMPPVGGTGAYSASISFKGAAARGAAGVFTLVVRVDPGMLGGATISHTVGASSPELDPAPANNSATETTSVTALADLAVTKGAAPGSVLAGQDVTYTIQVTNNGPDAAAGVSLAEAVPANTTFQSLATPAGWTSMTPPVGGTGPVTSTTPSLAPGATAVFTLVVRVDAGAPGGTIVANTSTAASATGDPNVANNSASATVFVDSTVDMAVSQAGSPEPATPGETIAYTITVANNGPDLPSAISLGGSIPANTTFESLAAPAGWSVATPPAGGTGAYSASISFEGEGARGGADVFTLVVRVDDAAPNAAVISHAVSVSSPEFDPNSANNTSTETTAVLSLMADVSVTKSATPEVVLAGQEITYTITVRNDGPDAAASVTLDDAVPANTAFQSLATPAGWTSATPPVGGAGTVTSTTPSLASGATAVFTLVVRVDDLALAGSVVSNTATALSAETLDPNGTNNSATTTTAVGAVPSADVSLVKSGTPSTVSPGSAITYTLVATNNGPNDATDLTISDPTPTDTTFVSAMASTGGVLTTPAAGAAGTVRATWPGVTPAGTTRTATIVVEVDSDTPTNTVITNLATATSGALDANAGNNLATQATNVVIDESIPVADLSITVDGLPGIVDTGTFLDYTIRVSNAGPDEAAGVRVSGSTPDGTRFVSLTGDGATFTTPAVGGVGSFEAYFERIGPGETATLHLVLNVVAEGGATIATSIGLSSETDDPTASNNATSTATRVQAGNDVLLTWDPPLECEDDCLNPPLHLQSSTVDEAGSRAAGGPGFTGHVRKLFKRNTVTGYNVYRSNMPDVQATPANFFTSVPPNQTQVVAPTAPGGSFFTVTATYPNGESGGTNAASGGLPEPDITGIVAKGKKILVVGEGFSDTVQVFVDGIPFVKNAKVKQAKGRVQQKGKLLTGQTVQEYIRQQGGVVLISVLNQDTGIGTFLYRP